MRRILAITCNDQGISWGPAVHFLELWNAFTRHFAGHYEVRGLSPSWTGLPPVKPATFKLYQERVPNIPALRQLVFDLIAAGWVVFLKKRLIYVRLSSYHLLVTVALAMTGKAFCLEMNGLSISDSRSSGRPAWFKLMTLKQEQWLIRRAAVVLAVSKSIGDYARESGASRVEVVPNSVSPDFYRIAQKSAIGPRIRVIYVGTYTSWDGSERLPLLARSFPDVEFMMVGDGRRRREIQACSPANMVYTGGVPYSQLPDYYASADAGVVLYERERHEKVELSSMKVLEYMAAGLPIFATDVPGLGFVKEHVLGRLCLSDDLTRDFELFLAELGFYKDNVERYRHAAGQQYSWVEAARLTERAIHECLSRHST